MQASFGEGSIGTNGLRLSGLPAPGFAAQPLYGPLFFNGKRFQRLERFETATSRQVIAQLRPDPGSKWFSAFEPGSFVLWDPGGSDAVLHALQVAVPHRRVLPISVERIDIDTAAGPLVHVSAIERRTLGATYTFDAEQEGSCPARQLATGARPVADGPPATDSDGVSRPG